MSFEKEKDDDCYIIDFDHVFTVPKWFSIFLMRNGLFDYGLSSDGRMFWGELTICNM